MISNIRSLTDELSKVVLERYGLVPPLSRAVGARRKRPSSSAATRTSKRRRKDVNEPIEISDSEDPDRQSEASRSSDSEVDTLGPESEEGVRDTPRVGTTSDNQARGEETAPNHELASDIAVLQVCLMDLDYFGRYPY